MQLRGTSNAYWKPKNDFKMKYKMFFGVNDRSMDATIRKRKDYRRMKKIIVHPLWNQVNGTGIDIAIIRILGTPLK